MNVEVEAPRRVRAVMWRLRTGVPSLTHGTLDEIKTLCGNRTGSGCTVLDGWPESPGPAGGDAFERFRRTGLCPSCESRWNASWERVRKAEAREEREERRAEERRLREAAEGLAGAELCGVAGHRWVDSFGARWCPECGARDKPEKEAGA